MSTLLHLLEANLIHDEGFHVGRSRKAWIHGIMVEEVLQKDMVLLWVLLFMKMLLAEGSYSGPFRRSKVGTIKMGFLEIKHVHFL